MPAKISTNKVAAYGTMLWLEQYDITSYRFQYSIVGYDIAAYGTTLWLGQYNKVTYRVRYNNTKASLEYQRVVGYNAARNTIQLHFCPVFPSIVIWFRSCEVRRLTRALMKLSKHWLKLIQSVY